MPKVKLNDIHLYYEQHGQGSPLVLIAGLTCDTLLWFPLLDELTKHFHVTIFDNRGVGQSDAPDRPYTIEMMAQDTLALMDHLQLQKAHVLGHSMGGAIAQTLAFQHGHRLNKIALCNSLIKLNQVSTWCQRFMLHLREEGASSQQLFEGIIPWIFSNDFLENEQQVEQAITLHIQSPHPQSNIGFKRQFEALASFDSSQWFNQIKLPTLVVNSEEDILCPRDSLRLAEGIKKAKLYSFPRMGHLPLIEKPEEFNRVIIDFFKN